MIARPTKLVRSERLKLRANALNSVAVAAVVAGFVTPLAALSFGLTSTPGRRLAATFAAAAAWFIMGLSLHVAANVLLGGLEE